MTSRERIHRIVARQPVDRCGFWLGNPHPDTLPIYFDYFSVGSLEELHLKLGSDFRWLTPQFMDSTYQHPQGRGIFDVWKYKTSLGAPGPLAECETVNDIETAYVWPSVEYLHFDECLAALRAAGEVYRASGFWAPFFHDVADLFGFEELLIKMHTHPELVEAVFDRVCTFYLDANARFFAEAGDEVDAYFFGNDLGTQRGLMIGPEQLDRFLFPWIRRFADQAHSSGYQVLLHSCGSVHEILGRFVAAGIECLHPLQALACDMDAGTLARDAKGSLSFLGGIDTQDLLVNATAEEVRKEVRRVIGLLGPHLIVSPSHEALLPNISPVNVAAMADEVLRSARD
jgi:uroporphyrinogen decarboxylase